LKTLFIGNLVRDTLATTKFWQTVCKEQQRLLQEYVKRILHWQVSNITLFILQLQVLILKEAGCLRCCYVNHRFRDIAGVVANEVTAATAGWAISVITAGVGLLGITQLLALALRSRFTTFFTSLLDVHGDQIPRGDVVSILSYY
jgi:hypothetical protein